MSSPPEWPARDASGSPVRRAAAREGAAEDVVGVEEAARLPAPAPEPEPDPTPEPDPEPDPDPDPDPAPDAGDGASDERRCMERFFSAALLQDGRQLSVCASSRCCAC